MLKIITISNVSRNICAQTSFGRVHSAYNNAVNISCGDEIITLQPRGSISSPLTLELDCSSEELNSLKLCPGTEVSFMRQGLYISGEYFDALHSSVWDAVLTKGDSSDSCMNSEFLTSCLRGIVPENGFSDLMLPEGERWKALPCAIEAAGILKTAFTEIKARELKAAAHTLTGLVGLGEGLTPSGDDYLCGVLAAAYCISSGDAEELKNELCSALKGCLRETNDISGAFLKCAIRGYFSRPVVALREGVELSEAMRDFAAIGHSSGADTLSGMIFLLTSIK